MLWGNIIVAPYFYERTETMAKRSLSKIRIYDEWAGGTYIQCTLMQLNDYNLLDSIVVDGEYEYSSGLNIKSLNTDFALIHDDSTSSEDAWYTNLSDAVFKRYVSNTTNKTIGWWADYSPILNVQCRGGSLGNAQVYYAFVLDDELQLAWIVAYIIDGSNNSTIRIVRAHNLYQYFQMRMRPIIGGGATHIATKTGLLATLSEDVEDVLIVAGGGGGGLAISGSAWDGSEIDILWSGNNNKMTVSVVGSSIVFILYSGATSIYTFTSPVGSAVADITKINVGFLIDNEQGVAKPSFIYNDGSDYYYNQEEPTDAQMELIYEWLQAGI